MLDAAVDYFNRIGDQSQIRTKIKQLYGRGIKTSSTAGSLDVLETYVRQGITTQVDAGMVEALSTGFGNKVVNALASLFSESGQKYTLATEANDNPEDAEKLLMDNREAGGYDTAIVRADKLSIQCGSAAVLLSFDGGTTQYQHIAPNAIRALYHETIERDGIVRGTDQREIEDASVVIIRLSSADIEKWNYLAIYGRSELYPQGRYTQYVAGNTLNVPEPYENGAIEFEIAGEMCNPLSHWAADKPEEDLPDYPIAVIYSGLTDSDTTFPITYSLYDTCRELSCAASHTLSKSQEAAAGTKTITTDETAAGKPLPRSLSGAVSLPAGMAFEFVSHDSQACMDAYDLIRKMMVDIASSYSVPDYMAVTNEHMLATDSGIALEVKTRPLIKFREFRARENSLSVRKIFAIEKSLISLFADEQEDPDAIAELYSCTQAWDAGELRMPENRKEKTERNIAVKNAGGIDEIEFIRRENGFDDDQDAIDFYDKMKKRAKEYPSLIPKKEDPKSQLGLFNRSNKQADGQQQQGNGEK